MMKSTIKVMLESRISNAPCISEEKEAALTSSFSSSESRKVEKKTQYRYRDKKYTTSSSSSLNGWTLYNTTYGNWGTTYSTTTKPTESNTLRITSTKQTKWGYYHYCNNQVFFAIFPLTKYLLYFS